MAFSFQHSSVNDLRRGNGHAGRKARMVAKQARCLSGKADAHHSTRPSCKAMLNSTFCSWKWSHATVWRSAWCEPTSALPPLLHADRNPRFHKTKCGTSMQRFMSPCSWTSNPTSRLCNWPYVGHPVRSRVIRHVRKWPTGRILQDAKPSCT